MPDVRAAPTKAPTRRDARDTGPATDPRDDPDSEPRERPTGSEALHGALADRRRHGVALLLAPSAVALALVVFPVWMGWFVLTCIAFVERAEFRGAPTGDR
jgi:hypothetical protein